ncbi:iron-siderophore ABC transporter substrate-binding protein [Thermomonospora umbrina]|uniref:Iron complex transport system substrate-binding protein n=1 Tax=Thermomonospora umbrina TaxID=111806 RepID=A0A3D9T5S6_9ACTN|nr:iron-siderophore ABC transporter substrate-binding protein [Thermomonospora umbrina]REF00055.1 iron complex transport system substrate-binding protein [Thermomonospora umbrina]
MPPTSAPVPGARPAMRLLTALAALMLTLGLTACGGGSDDGGSGNAAPSGAAGESFPVTVEHLYGATEVKKRPQRIVTIGLSDHEPVLAFGHKPVGVVDWFERKPFSDWPWTKALWGGTEPTNLGLREENINFEKLLSLRPDLIVAVYSGIQKAQYEKLSKIAPVIAQPKGHDPYAAPWQVMTLQIGKGLGQEVKAKRLVADIEAKFAEVREANPQWKGKTALAADSFKAGTYFAFQQGDPKSGFLADLGFTVPPKINKEAGKLNGVEFGSERLDLLDVDRLVWITTGKEPQPRIKNDSVYRTLKVAKEGRDLFLTYQDPPIGGAISFNTVLSIPYAIDQLVPLLKK